MQKAQQQALVQNTNQAILQIRQAELNYYVSFYLTFGAQAAIIGGFAYQALTQISFAEGRDAGSFYPIIQDLFWIASACTMAAAMHCVLTSMFLQVLGPGLALHGPLGSMAKAADGMRREINHIFLAFVIMSVAFAVSTLMSFWVVMDKRSALLSSIIFLISSGFWWRYCSRIYNKFNFGDYVADYGQENEEGVDGEYQQPDEVVNPMVNGSGKEGGGGGSGGSGVVLQGYLTKSDNVSSKGPSARKAFTFQRTYFVLMASGRIFNFQSKTTFDERPNNPISDRPIELSWFHISTICFLDPENGEDVLYEIRLEYLDEDDHGNPIVFRCDTKSEQETWAAAMRQTIGVTHKD